MLVFLLLLSKSSARVIFQLKRNKHRHLHGQYYLFESISLLRGIINRKNIEITVFGVVREIIVYLEAAERDNDDDKDWRRS